MRDINEIILVGRLTKAPEIKMTPNNVKSARFTVASSDDYKKNGGDWPTYERKFLDLMGSRHIESKVDRYLLDGACLLCSEPTPHHCHRRLVAEYLKEKWGDVEIQHL